MLRHILGFLAIILIVYFVNWKRFVVYKFTPVFFRRELANVSCQTSSKRIRTPLFYDRSPKHTVFFSSEDKNLFKNLHSLNLC